MSRQGTWEDERGFTLVELLAVIIIMCIVLSIASSTWFRVVESRRVDSATNQLAADLRLAHTRCLLRGLTVEQEPSDSPTKDDM